MRSTFAVAPGFFANAVVTVSKKQEVALALDGTIESNTAAYQVYALWFRNHFESMLSGGEMFSTCALVARFRYGKHFCVHRNTPLPLTWCIKSYRFIGVSAVLVR